MIPRIVSLELALTVAGDPGDAEDLARADPQRHFAETHPTALGAGRDPGQLEHGEIADLPATARANAAELALEHHLDEDLLGRLGTEKGARDAALAEHRDPVGAPEDVLHPVGDQHDRVPVGAEASERAEERRDLVLREHARRLVQDQDPGVGQQELEELDLLLLSDGKTAHEGLGVDLEPVARGKLPDAVADLAPSRAGPRSGRKSATFSATVKAGTSRRSWNTMPIECPRASCGERMLTGDPSTRISPPSGRYTP